MSGEGFAMIMSLDWVAFWLLSVAIAWAVGVTEDGKRNSNVSLSSEVYIAEFTPDSSGTAVENESGMGAGAPEPSYHWVVALFPLIGKHTRFLHVSLFHRCF